MNIIRSIIPFDLLVDTDMGVLKYVQISYPPTWGDFFYPELMEMIDPEYNAFLQDILIHRSFANPLCSLVKPEKMIIAHPDNFYERLMEKEKNMILKLSMNTAIMEMVCKSLFLQDSLRFDILCKDEKESDELMTRFKKHFKTPSIPSSIIIDKPEKVDMSKYGNIYLKDIRDIKKYKHPIEGKNIIIANYTFNKEVDPVTCEIEETPSLDIIGDYLSTNKVKFIDVYSIDKNEVAVG